MTKQRTKVFISYGRADASEFASNLADWLRSEGYEPWLDVENGISIGSPFDVKIELGIASSNVLIAVLSPSSLRLGGFCRNELLFAQAKSVPIIPVRIAEVDPPIQIISLNYLDLINDPGEAFNRLSPLIEQVLSSGHMSPRDWASCGGKQPWWASEQLLGFESELARHGGRFVGRKWMFDQIQQWIKGPEARVLLLTADAGVGKSAIASQMTTRSNVCGVHFCSQSNIESCRPAAWVRGLVFQLATQLPPYRQELAKLSAPNWEQPASLFRTLIAEPLRLCEAQLDVIEPLVFVVDGLDESVAVAGRDLAELLADSAEHFPSWLRLLVTCRPDDSILAMFCVDGIRRKHVDVESELNLDDLRVYLEERFGELMAGHSTPSQRSVKSKLYSIASGNFLFAKMTLDTLEDAESGEDLALEEFVELPNKLSGLYHAMFRKRFRDQEAYEEQIGPLLDCLVAFLGKSRGSFEVETSVYFHTTSGRFCGAETLWVVWTWVGGGCLHGAALWRNGRGW